MVEKPDRGGRFTLTGSADDARHAARRAIGNLPLRRVTWLHDGWQDLRHSFLQVTRDTRLAIVVVLTLGLGVGANTGIFSIVDGFRRPLPVRHPEQLVVLAAKVKGDEGGRRYKQSFAALQDLRRVEGPVTDLFGFSLDLTGITIGGRPFPFVYAAVTGNYFSALGVAPYAGRLFAPGDGEHVGDDAVVVLGHAFWQRHFAGDPSVVGTQVRIGGTSAIIAGIVPPTFRGTYTPLEIDGYLTLNSVRADAEWSRRMLSDRTARWLTVLGRLKPGIALEEAQASMTLAAQRLEREYPDDRGIGIRVVPEPWARPDPAGLLGESGRSDRAAGLLLIALAALVLALACVNVANLLLVRSLGRQREMAVRAALGASRGRLVRQAITETMVLSLLGAGAGLLLGRVASLTFERSLYLSPDLSLSLNFGIDWRVFAYALSAAVITGIVMAIWPVIRAFRSGTTVPLHDGARGSSGPARQRLRALLVCGQVGGSLVLLIVAALFVRDLRGTERFEIGFDVDRLLNVRMDPSWAGYDAPRTETFYRDLERRVSSLPGVEAVSLAFSVPLGYYWSAAPVFVDGSPRDPTEPAPMIPRNFVGPRYFTTLRLPIVRGRAFEEYDDSQSSRVAIVNETMATRFWPAADAIGKTFRADAADAPPLRVVGVVKDSKVVTLWEPPTPQFYTPLAQTPTTMRVLQVRSSTPPDRLGPLIRREIQNLGPEVPIADLQTMKQALGTAGGYMLLRLAAIQAGAMGLLGLLLAVVGVYGVTSYGAAQRTHEVGIRMALGAASHEVLALILRQGVLVVAGGIIVGLAGAVAATRVLASVLGMKRAGDPLVFVSMTLLLSLVALAACVLPAHRATRSRRRRHCVTSEDRLLTA